MADEDKSSTLSQVYVLLVAIAAMALTFTVYHCVVVLWCNHRLRAGPRRRQTIGPGQGEARSSVEISTVELIPAHKYQKGMGLDGEDGVCPVCLSEFEEGEELRMLPECMHSFHARCIDMWLCSHPNCPVCRTDATPSPGHILGSGFDGDAREDSTIAHDVGVRNMEV